MTPVSASSSVRELRSGKSRGSSIIIKPDQLLAQAVDIASDIGHQSNSYTKII